MKDSEIKRKAAKCASQTGVLLSVGFLTYPSDKSGHSLDGNY
jgi:hypothetical protein